MLELKLTQVGFNEYFVRDEYKSYILNLKVKEFQKVHYGKFDNFINTHSIETHFSWGNISMIYMSRNLIISTQ